MCGIDGGFRKETGKQGSEGEDNVMYMRACAIEMSEAKSRGCRMCTRNKPRISGGDALKGNTRSHPEHDG